MPNSSDMTLPSLIIGLRPKSGNDFYLNRGMLRLRHGAIWGAIANKMGQVAVPVNQFYGTALTSRAMLTCEFEEDQFGCFRSLQRHQKPPVHQFFARLDGRWMRSVFERHSILAVGIEPLEA